MDVENLNSISLKEELALVYSRCKVSHSAMNKINAVLRKHGKDVPKTARNHLKTNKKSEVLEKKTVAHFPVEEQILCSIKNIPKSDLPCVIHLHFNVDGIPHHNSTTKNFWVISEMVIKISNTAVFPIKIFFEEKKPKSCRAFLSRFISELGNLLSEGITFDGRNFKVNVRAILCDAPARSFVKGIVGHNGCNACEGCNQYGVYTHRRITFPFVLSGNLRTDEEVLEEDFLKY